jgi:hypothetical protein
MGGGTDRRGVVEDRWRRAVGWTSELLSRRAAAKGQHTTARDGWGMAATGRDGVETGEGWQSTR